MLMKDKYAFLSNFYECPVAFEGYFYNNSEAAFQASKYSDENANLKKEFENLPPNLAKRKGRSIPIRSDWESIKDKVMSDIVYCKFIQNPDLAKKLIATGDIEIVEDNTWNDTYWGRCNGKGKNMLGIILMQVREKLKKELK